MASRQISTQHVEGTLYGDYLGKAEQFYHVMKYCYEDGEYDAVLLNGVHAAISMTDAILVFQKQIRSTSKNHQDAVALLQQHLSSNAELKQNVNRLAQIISKKNAVEYQPARFTAREAVEFCKKVERFFDWARTKLPERSVQE